MNTDIYTRKVVKQFTEEHIIPNSLGGQLTSCELIDKTTNDHFGSTIDAALAQSLRSIIVSIDARSDRKPNDPAHSMQVASEEGEVYDIKAGGIVRPKPKLNIQVNGREIHINGSAPDLTEVRQALKNTAKRLGLSLDKLMEQVKSIASERIELMPTLHFPVGLWDSAPYRATAKIACNLLGMHARALFLRPEFDPIRQFVLYGTQPAVWPVQAAPVDIRQPESARIGSLDHLAVVRGDASSGQVTGLITYFGALWPRAGITFQFG